LLKSQSTASKAAASGLLAPFYTAWHHRSLILRLARREIDARYRGSVLGIVWAVLTPILMLAVYTFVFSVVFRARWGTTGESNSEFALLLFSGLILFNVLGECLNRAPGLLLENVSYIKKVVFPLEILPVVALVGALFNAGIGFVILMVFHLFTAGLPPVTTLLLPMVLVPLCLTTLGLTCFFASVGVFLRDVRQVVGVGVTVLMFLSPIFYPISAIPEHIRPILHLNPMTAILEQSKELLFWGHVPSLSHWLLATLGSWGVAWLGHLWFMKTRRGFADVV
jgi:lipopolysaccharide transport system permease protein